MVDRVPLRVKLVAAILVLVLAGLMVIGAVSVFALRSYLMDGVDQQLLTAAVGLMKASCKSLVSDAGRGLPSHFSSSGFGSNKSSWLGPPSMNMKMTFLAFGANIGGLGASGFVSTVAP